MIFQDLPIEIKKYIETYLYGFCVKCHLKKYYFNLKHDVHFYEHISIFNDEWEDFFAFKNPIKYKLICDFCFE